MNPARRSTPDSEALMSSEEDERPVKHLTSTKHLPSQSTTTKHLPSQSTTTKHLPSSSQPWPSIQQPFGRFIVEDNQNVPGHPGSIWSTQKRGSFRTADPSQRHIALEACLGASKPSHNALRAGSTPSPSVSESAATSLPFAIPLQPTPKLGRSLSHSQGQRDFTQAPGPHSGHAALPLGLLTEENDTESESELGDRLTQTTSHPPIGSAFRTSTFPTPYDAPHHGGNIKSPTDNLTGANTGQKLDRRFEAAFHDLTLDLPQRRSQWQSSLGWDDVPNVNESRRHSLAELPTRRGSLAGGESGQSGRFLTRDATDPNMTPFSNLRSSDRSADFANPSQSGLTTRLQISEIAAMYRPMSHHELEQQDLETRRTQQQFAGPGVLGRARKQLYIVSFKCSRVDVFYLLDNTGLAVREGDLVIVEADRGQDLGTVQHARVSPDAARELKNKYSEEQYKWLMMYSRNKEGGHNPNAQLHGEPSGSFVHPDAPSSIQGMLPRDGYMNLKPKAIKRLASDHEIKMLAEKEGNEAKAKRTCQQKVVHLRLEMEILDAEWQWDFQKLIFYYYADKYINFKDLITELYRIYKTRIWLSAINPASFSQHAMGQAPSGIGPGAVPPFNQYSMNNSYTMAYGEDGDPYGAQMPYSIPYNTYTPNYPAIPGVANSFNPQQLQNNPYMYLGGAPQTNAAQVVPMQAATQMQVAPQMQTADPVFAAANAMYPQNTIFNRATGIAYPRQIESEVSSQAGGVPLPPTSLSNTNTAGPFPQVGLWNARPFHPAQVARDHQAAFPSPIGTRPAAQSNITAAAGDNTGDEQQPSQWETMRALHALNPQNVARARQSISSGTASLSEHLQSMNLQGGTVDRYLTSLPSPDQFRSNEQ